MQPETSIIAITANGSVNRAVEAMRAGAHDFLVKPFDEGRLLSAPCRTRWPNAAPARRRRTRRPPAPPPAARDAEHRSTEGSGFIGSSDAMERIHATIASVARSMATVFITGESGTGKELCALAVHANSARATGPFIALNCGAIPQDLLESEVFGHMKGSFTGAISDKPGAAAAADGGTLFLDEICEMAPALQTKLLRFLQTSTVQPVGATRPTQGQRPHRLRHQPRPAGCRPPRPFPRGPVLPPLRRADPHAAPARPRPGHDRDRRSRPLPLCPGRGPRVPRPRPRRCATCLSRLPWPGNVRQLLNVMRNVVVLNHGGWVTPDMLPPGLVDASADPADPPAGPAPGSRAAIDSTASSA